MLSDLCVSFGSIHWWKCQRCQFSAWAIGFKMLVEIFHISKNKFEGWQCTIDIMEMIGRFCTTLEHPWLILWSISPFSLFSLFCSSSSSTSSFVSLLSCVLVSLSHFCITWWIQFSNVVRKRLIISIIPNLQTSNSHSYSLLTHWDTVVCHLTRSMIPLRLNRKKEKNSWCFFSRF